MKDLIERQAAIDAIDVLCQEHRYRIPGKAETYGQYNEAWQDALGRAEGVICDLPSAEPEIIRCRDCVKREICRTTNIWAVAPDDDWFCGDAERRTDEGE